jgi:hypothetical protein
MHRVAGFAASPGSPGLLAALWDSAVAKMPPTISGPEAGFG